MHEYYPTLWEMAPWHKKYPITWIDGRHIFHGPKVGAQAPDGYVVVRSNEPKVSRKSLLDPTKLTILLFDGIDHGDTTSQTKSLADSLEASYGDRVQCFVITRYYDHQHYDAINNILGDIDLSLEKKFAATGQSIYVIAPDGRIVWKSCGLMEGELEKWLDSKTVGQ